MQIQDHRQVCRGAGAQKDIDFSLVVFQPGVIDRLNEYIELLLAEIRSLVGGPGKGE